MNRSITASCHRQCVSERSGANGRPTTCKNPRKHPFNLKNQLVVVQYLHSLQSEVFFTFSIGFRYDILKTKYLF